MEMYPLHSTRHIMHYMNGMCDDLILQIFNDFVIQLWFLIFDAYILVGLELHGWIHWKYDYN